MSGHLGLFVDLGSTFTKLRVVELTTGRLAASSQAPTTVTTDVNEGLEAALGGLPPAYRRPWRDFTVAASSSAAGGLRIVAVGLVQDLTAKAAEAAALSAGGKVVAVYANGLTAQDLDEIEAASADLILLAGGTDGGDERCITRNADVLAQSTIDCEVIVAGNRNATDEVVRRLAKSGKECHIAPNVLPSLERIETVAVADVIRDAFMRHITHAKGLDRAEEAIGRVAMPTPQAVLRAVELLSKGATTDDGWGDLLCVDLGGATTDVYSVGEGRPTDRSTVLHGLPEPVSKRTVEADLGMRISAAGVLEATDRDDLARIGAPAAVAELVERWVGEPAILPSSRIEIDAEQLLASTAVRTAVHRHVGSVEVAYGPHGQFFVQRGKDLRDLRVLVGTGGVLRTPPADAVASILGAACFDADHPLSLAPESPRIFVDRGYALFAAGLLAEIDARTALRLLKSTVVEIGTP